MFCRETRRLLERLIYGSSEDVPVTAVQVARWYLLRHLHAKSDEEQMNVSTLFHCVCSVYAFITTYKVPHLTALMNHLQTCNGALFFSRSFCNMPKQMEMKGC